MAKLPLNTSTTFWGQASQLSGWKTALLSMENLTFVNHYSLAKGKVLLGLKFVGKYVVTLWLADGP